MLNSPDAYSLFLGFSGGLFSTLLMTFTEIPSWKRWGLQGVLEWHENQVITEKFLKLSSEKMYFKGMFALHFLNGGLGGVGFVLVLWFFPMVISQIFLSAIIYGFFLWIITLVLIHKPITGISPWRHPLGHFPALVSLVGHFVYGVVLGYFFLKTPL